MKYLFLFLLLAFCGGLFGQTGFYVDTLASNTAFAQLRVNDTLPNGSVQTYTEPYDSVDNVIDFATLLFLEGGFVASFPVPPISEIAEGVRVGIQYKDGIGDVRQRLRELVTELTSDPLYQGTPTDIEEDDYTLFRLPGIGYNSDSPCAEYVGEITIEFDGQLVMTGFPFSPYYAINMLSDDMFRLSNSSGKYLSVYVLDGNVWKSPDGCAFTR